MNKTGGGVTAMKLKKFFSFVLALALLAAMNLHQARQSLVVSG